MWNAKPAPKPLSPEARAILAEDLDGPAIVQVPIRCTLAHQQALQDYESFNGENFDFDALVGLAVREKLDEILHSFPQEKSELRKAIEKRDSGK